jgi:hypothetical protein
VISFNNGGLRISTIDRESSKTKPIVRKDELHRKFYISYKVYKFLFSVMRSQELLSLMKDRIITINMILIYNKGTL